MPKKAGKNGGDPVGVIGVRAAARALELSASTISRYLKDFPVLNLGNDTLPKVDLAVLRRHRLENVNPAVRGRRAAKLLGEGERHKKGAAQSYAASRAARERVLARRAQIDLDARLGLLVPREEIQAAIFDAGRVLQRDLLELGAQLSERIAVMDDPREIAELLVTEHRRILAALASSLRTDAAAEEEPRPT